MLILALLEVVFPEVQVIWSQEPETVPTMEMGFLFISRAVGVKITQFLIFWFRFELGLLHSHQMEIKTANHIMFSVVYPRLQLSK